MTLPRVREGAALLSSLKEREAKLKAENEILLASNASLQTRLDELAPQAAQATQLQKDLVQLEDRQVGALRSLAMLLLDALAACLTQAMLSCTCFHFCFATAGS